MMRLTILARFCFCFSNNPQNKHSRLKLRIIPFFTMVFFFGTFMNRFTPKSFRGVPGVTGRGFNELWRKADGAKKNKARRWILIFSTTPRKKFRESWTDLETRKKTPQKKLLTNFKNERGLELRRGFRGLAGQQNISISNSKLSCFLRGVHFRQFYEPFLTRVFPEGAKFTVFHEEANLGL